MDAGGDKVSQDMRLELQLQRRARSGRNASVFLSEDLWARLEDYWRSVQVRHPEVRMSRSDILRQALDAYLTAREK
jgi:hypothetical protein